MKVCFKVRNDTINYILGGAEKGDRDFPDVPKNWGFMTLRRNKKK